MEPNINIQSNKTLTKNGEQAALVHPILLASSSRYRALLLERLHISFDTYAPNIDETPHEQESPLEVVSRLSFEKALAAQQHFPHHIIIASDQVAFIKEDEHPSLSGIKNNVPLLSKPLTHSNAEKQLSACSGKTVRFLTGLCCLPPFELLKEQGADKRADSMRSQYCEVEKVDVTFRQLSQQEILRYLDLESPLDCAGSFKAEGLGITLFEKLESTDPNTIVGLPLIALSKRLRALGINPLSKT